MSSADLINPCDMAWPRVARRLRRLCDEFGWEMVLVVFSSGLMEEPPKEKEALKKTGARFDE